MEITGLQVGVSKRGGRRGVLETRSLSEGHVGGCAVPWAGGCTHASGAEAGRLLRYRFGANSLQVLVEIKASIKVRAAGGSN